MWEVKCVSYYINTGDPGLQYDEQWRLQGSEYAALEARVNQICTEDGWEPFAYSDNGVSMWLRRQA